MEFTVNKNLTKKLKGLVEIGVSNDDGLIMGIKENDELIPLSQEIMELVCISLMDKKKTLISFCDMEFKVTVGVTTGLTITR